MTVAGPRSLATDPLEALAGRIRSRDARVAVVGLGYVGLPLLLEVARAGFPVLGLDSDAGRVASLRQRRSYLVDVADSELAALEEAEFHTDPAALGEAEVVLICVPTPLADHVPDLSAVRAATEQVARHLAPGRLVVLESTTYPGTTQEVVLPILAASGLEVGAGFGLAYSPERIDPGSRERRIHNTPKVVAGVTERCRELAVSFYSHLVREVVTTPTPREAEMAKLIENTFRQVNIALVNELAVTAHDLGVDIWEALRAAATKPFGYMPFWPGPGVGGHCIGIDPTYLSWRAGGKRGYHIGFIEHANEVNNRMPEYVVARLAEALNDQGKALRGSWVLAVGVTYKPGVEDVRGSPALAVLEQLGRRGALLAYHDPFVPEVEVAGARLRAQELDEATVAAQDAVIVLTAHRSVDYPMLARTAALLFDTRGVTLGLRGRNVVRL